MELAKAEIAGDSRTRGLRRGGPGRRKGIPNKTTQEVRTAAQRLVNDKRYRARLRRRLIDGTAAPAVEVLMWHYAYGKPKDIDEHLNVDPSNWTREQCEAYLGGVPLVRVLCMSTQTAPLLVRQREQTNTLGRCEDPLERQAESGASERRTVGQ